MSLRIVFAGTPEFSVPALNALIQHHQVLAVFTQPDRPSGRGRKIRQNPVKQVATAHQIPVFQPANLQSIAEHQIIQSFKADIMVVVAYGVILPSEILSISALNCLNIHASLLPKWRGAAPIHRAILNGDTETGISIMQMDEGLDTGHILLTHKIPINPNDTTSIVHDKLAQLGAKSILEALDHFKELSPKAQSNNDATYAHKISKHEARIDWQQPASHIHNQIRAFNPWPVAHTDIDNKTIRIWQAVVDYTPCNKPAGTVLVFDKSKLQIACVDARINIQKIQLAGRNIMPIADFFNTNHNIQIGDLLG